MGLNPVVDIIVPTYGRAERLAAVVADVHAATSQPHVVTLALESDDIASMQVGLELCAEDRQVRLVGNDRAASYAGALNAAVLTSDAPLWFAGADDLHFHPLWLEHAQAALDEQFLVVGTNDLLNVYVLNGLHATHYLVDRRYTDGQGGTLTDGPGIALHEGYSHNYVDTEFVGVAKARVRFRPALRSVVEHLHPSVGKGPVDATFLRTRQGYDADAALYDSRKGAWWDLSR